MRTLFMIVVLLFGLIPVAIAQDEAETGLVLDGDEQICEQECSLDIGVNDYLDDEDAEVLQFGVAWGQPFIEWDGNITDGEMGFVVLFPGWYLDLTVAESGGMAVYNYPTDWTDEQLGDALAGLHQQLAPDAEMVVWDSEVESFSNSALGDEGVGPGDDYPQLDGQQFSCFPQLGPCPLVVTVAEERQIAIAFGMQIDYQTLSGAHSDDLQESIRQPEYRCDMVVLRPGTFDGLILRDARVEVYNVPDLDQSGWFRNLIAERAEEQAAHYGCPQHETISIWSADGTSVEEYSLRWDDDDATASGPEVIDEEVEETAAG